jgi:hypothetical protein
MNFFNNWAKRFRCDAVMDSAALLRNQLKRLELPDEPAKLIEGTILLVATAAAYAANDKADRQAFIAQQAYHPALDPDTYYAFTFNLRDHAYGRIITPLDKKTLDLADLWGHAWPEFKSCGYSEIRISRLDNNDLSDVECDRLEKTITDDIFFDFSEDDLWIVFDREVVTGILVAYFFDMETDVEMG